MSQSMTGFGKAENENEKFSVLVEIKSVNHRFKDIRFRSGSLFNDIEVELRKKLEAVFKRGSFDVYIHYKKKNKSESFDNIDFEKVRNFTKKMQSEVGEVIKLRIDPTHFLKADFQEENDLKNDETFKPLAIKSFEQALIELEKSRNTEGKSLVAILSKHREEYEKHFNLIEGHIADFQKEIKSNLLKKFKEFEAELKIDENRFAQEVIYYMEKMDIHEEINRIKTHLASLDEMLGTNGEKGRKIDFLIQELNRETNTIGSKSTKKEISTSIIEMKSQLEKIREQALNMQ